MRLIRYAIVVLAISAIPALADEKADCADGIAMIETALAAKPTETALPKLKKALKAAKREQSEGEFDECLDAVGDAKRAMAK
jgi:hypothetical protein